MGYCTDMQNTYRNLNTRKLSISGITQQYLRELTAPAVTSEGDLLGAGTVISTGASGYGPCGLACSHVRVNGVVHSIPLTIPKKHKLARLVGVK